MRLFAKLNLLGKLEAVKSRVQELPLTLAIVPTGSSSKLTNEKPAKLAFGVVSN